MFWYSAGGSAVFDGAGGEGLLANAVSFSGLLAVMAMCAVLRRKQPHMATRLAVQCGSLWTLAEIFLFALVGASVDLSVAGAAGLPMLLMLALGLLCRMGGVGLCVLGTPLNKRERLFCLLAELPKATVQAAIGGFPLAMGLACGNTVLTFAVLAILITAPLGAFAIDSTCHRWLVQEQKTAKKP